MCLLSSFADAIASSRGLWLRVSVSGIIDAGKLGRFTHFRDLFGDVGIAVAWQLLVCEAEIVF